MLSISRIFALLVLVGVAFSAVKAGNRALVETIYKFQQHATYVEQAGAWHGNRLLKKVCYQILWDAPEFDRVHGVQIFLEGALRKFRASAGVNVNGIFMDRRIERRGNRFVSGWYGLRAEQYFKKKVRFMKNKVIQSKHVIDLGHVCVLGHRRKSVALSKGDEIKLSVLLAYESKRINRTAEIVDKDSPLLFLRLSEERLARDIASAPKVSLEGIRMIQLPDEGYDAFGIRYQLYNGDESSMCLYWFSGVHAVSPINLRNFEDDNIRLVVPSLSLSQFANDYGYDATWTGVEWGFFEERREWCLMTPYGTLHTIRGAESQFEWSPVSGATPIMVFSKHRETLLALDVKSGPGIGHPQQ